MKSWTLSWSYWNQIGNYLECCGFHDLAYKIQNELSNVGWEHIVMIILTDEEVLLLEMATDDLVGGDEC